MADKVDPEDWSELAQSLNDTMAFLDKRQPASVKESILNFSATAAMLGLEDLAEAGKKIEQFFLTRIAAKWDEEAAATLSFTIASLKEKMEAEAYGPEFSSALDGILVFLDYYETDDEEPEPPSAVEAASVPAPGPGPDVELQPSSVEPEEEADEIPSVPVQEGIGTAEPVSDFDEAAEFDEAKAIEDLLKSAGIEEPSEEEEAALIDMLAEEPAEERPEMVSKRTASPPEPFTEAASEEQIAQRSDETAGVRKEKSMRDVLAEFSMLDALAEAPPDEIPETELVIEDSKTMFLTEVPVSAPLSRPEPSPRPPVEIPQTELAGDMVRLYRRMLSLDPASSVFVKLAEELCAREIWDEAAETCRRGLAFHPGNLRGKVLLGRALWELGEEKDASEILEKAQEDIEQNIVLYRILAEVAEQNGDSARSRHFHRIYRAHHGDDVELYERSAPKTPPEIEIEVETEMSEPQLLGALTALLTRFEKDAKPAPPQVPIFSEEVRDGLKRMLASGMA